MARTSTVSYDVLHLGVTVDARPETANIQFFTEYSITEAAAPKGVKEQFASLDLAGKERPDLLILIDHHPAATLIAIEAKMFSAIRPKRLESQMQRQREKILCPLRELLKVKIPEVKILHLALLPQKLIEAWKMDCPSELSALRASCIRIVTWENILAPFKKGG
jgi:hypothetical protein